MRSWGEWGNELHYAMHGIDVQNEVWKINGLRHVVDFSVSHRNQPVGLRETALIPLMTIHWDLNMGHRPFGQIGVR